MNRADTKELIQRNGVIALKADKTSTAPEIDQLLVELGNTGMGIPFYAIYPGRGGAPIVFDGPITMAMVIERLTEAGPSSEITSGDATATAMK